MKEMEIKIRKLSEIRPYFNNPRDNNKAVPPIMESIRKYGFVKPILCDMDGVIICGHTRYIAAFRLGLDKVPVIYSDMDEEFAKQYRIVDNKIAEKSEFDEDEMIEKLKGMKMPEDMQAFFFSDVKDLISPDIPKFDAMTSVNVGQHEDEQMLPVDDRMETSMGNDGQELTDKEENEDDDLTDIYKVKVIDGRKKMKVVCPYCGNIEIIEVQ